jgi:hypothetical protein
VRKAEPQASDLERSKKSTPVEMVARRSFVRRLIFSGLTVDQIAQNATGKYTPEEVSRTYREIVGGWRREQEQADGTARTEAIQRLRRDLAEMRNPGQLRNKNGYPVFENVLDADGNPKKVGRKLLKKPVQAPIDWAAVAKHETLLAKIEGTMKPVELKVDVDVSIRQSMLAVIANMTPEQIDRYAEEDIELERRAKRAM